MSNSFWPPETAEAILESEPKSVSALNFMAISYLKEKEYSKAL